MSEVAALLSREEQSKSNIGSRSAYPFWSLPMNSSVLIRFLPDKNQDNPFPWVERRLIKMPFAGIVGSDADTENEVLVQVPCVETWGEKCPVTQAIRPWWNGSDEERDLARRFYRRPSWVMGGFVVSSPMTESFVPDNPIRTFHLNKQVYQIIHDTIMDCEMECVPWSTEGGEGRDFRLAKTAQGQYASYTTSRWSQKPRALTEEELAAIAKFGLPDLSKEAGEKPSQEVIDMIPELFQAALAGEPFDNRRWGQHFRVVSRGAKGGTYGPQAVVPPGDEAVTAAAATVTALKRSAKVGA
jgi:hypothetical protein